MTTFLGMLLITRAGGETIARTNKQLGNGTEKRGTRQREWDAVLIKPLWLVDLA